MTTTQQRSGPRVIEEDAPRDTRSPGAGPAVFATEATARVVPVQRAVTAPAAAKKPRRRDRWVRLGLWGIGAAIAGWLVIDSYFWIVDAFARSPTFGWLAVAVVTAGLGGAALIILREMKSFFALRSVEHNQERLEHAGERPASPEAREAIRQVLAAVPRDRESEAAIETYQRQAQAHHTPAQQIEMLSRTVMAPLDRRAEAVIRRATGRAFAVTAIAPITLIDTVVFAALSIHMMRGIAACYGHRPTAAATVHLLRRLIFEAGKLGAVGFAGMAVSQHLGGALLEKIATDAAESMYAAQRVARVGLITMSMCRPVPFRPEETPGIFSSLIGNLFGQKKQG